MRHPIDYTFPNGEKTTLYPIGYLAVELGRDTSTIRKWEVGDVIPASIFRHKGRRMYTQEMIDLIVKYAEKYKIVQGRSVKNSNFSRYVHIEMNKLFEEYKEKMKKE